MKATLYKNKQAQKEARLYAQQTQSWQEVQQANGTCISAQKIGRDSLLEYYCTHNAQVATLLKANTLWAGGSLGENIQGQGLLLALWDAGAVQTIHQELQGRSIQKDGAFPPTLHATHIAGTLIGAGITPEAKGIAPAATLHAYDWNNDLSEMTEAAEQGLLVSCHPYGKLTGWHQREGTWYWMGNSRISSTTDYRFGFYDEDAAQRDALAYRAPYYLMVYSAGNDRAEKGPAPNEPHFVRNRNGLWQRSTVQRQPDGPYDALNPLAVAKNILTVGAVAQDFSSSTYTPAPFTSFGPTDDGRIKPDLAGIGVNVFSASAQSFNSYDTQSGTSIAAAGVAASLGLLQQYYQQLNGGQVMLASTLKALAIHTAQDIGAEGPDYQLGWGLFNAEAAAHVIRQKGITTQILEIDLEQGATYTLNLLAAGNGVPLAATIAWADPEATPPPPSLNPTRRMLVNDLDLVIERENQHFLPYILDPNNPSAPAIKGNNNRDNVEKVWIGRPIAGIYTLKITHKGTLRGNRQKVSIIITGLAPAEFCPAPPIAGVIDAPLQATRNAIINFSLVGSSGGTVFWEISRDSLTWQSFSTANGATSFQTSFSELGTFYLRAAIAKLDCPLIYSSRHKITITEPTSIFLPDSLNRSVYCIGSNLTLSFTTAGNFNSNNQFRLEISNASGSFTSPFTLASLNANASASISATIPVFFQPSRNYRIRLVGSSPPTQSNFINIQLTRCCSGNTTFTAANGEISQGSNQAPYGNDLDCTWLIQPPGAQAIRLQFESFSTQPLADYVSVYDGSTTDAPLLGKFSGHNLPPELVSTKGEMLVTFRSNSQITSNGFFARYQAQNYGVKITNFNSSILCSEKDHEIAFEASSRANSGNTFILELSDSAGNFTRATTLSRVETTNSSGLFSFRIPSDVVPGAFYRLRIRSTSPNAASAATDFVTIRNCNDPCQAGAILTAPNGNFSDGNTSGEYGNNLSCSWLIEPSNAAAIELRFERFSTERCCDFVTVYDGNSDEAPILKRLSGTGDSEPIRSSAGSMFVTFTTDGSISSSGWQASYQTLSRTLRFQFNQTQPRLCIDSVQVIRFIAIGEFDAQNTFRLELSTPDGNFTQPRLLSTLTTNQSGEFRFLLPADVAEGQNYRLRIVASSPSFISVPSIPIAVTGCKTYCSGTQVYTALQGNFDDGSGALPYGNNSLCRFLIAPENNPAGIEVKITSLETESNQDFLRIYDGENENAPLIAELSGRINDYIITSSGAKILLVFLSNNFGVRQGFQVEYRALNSNILIQELPSSLCIGDTLLLRFKTIGNFDSNNTFTVWLSDRNGNFTSARQLASIENISRDTAIKAILENIPEGNNYRLRVTATSPRIVGAISPVNIKLYICPSCEGQQVLTEPQGIFADRRRGPTYSNNLDCSWLIQPPQANFIRLQFLHFDTEACCDEVTVYNGATTTDLVLGRFRGDELPDEIIGDAGAMLITFRTDGSVNASGWIAKYEVQNEGIKILGWSTPILICGESQTFEYEGVGNFTPGTEFLLQMSDENGSWENARILYSTPAHAGPRTVTFQWPLNIEDGASYKLRMITNTEPRISSSTIEVTLTCPTCHGETILNAPSGTFTDGSLENQNYSNDLYCTWLIAPEPRIGLLKLSFSRFETETCCDKLHIYAGKDENGEFLGTFRGNSIPPTFLTDSSSFFLIFETDASVTRKGWEANYEQVEQYIWATNNLNSRLCPGDTFSLSYRLIGSFDVNNQIIAELSEANGNFTNPIIIAQLQSNTSGVLNCQLPAPLALGNYRIRLRTTSPALIGGSTTSFEISSNCPTCQGLQVLSQITGSLEDGSGENDYGNNLNCSWLIAPPGASEVILEFESFDTESCCDELVVYDGASTQAPRLGSFKGNQLPPTLVASSGKMLLVFITDGSITEAGFRAHWYSSHAYLQLNTLPRNEFCPNDTFEVSFYTSILLDTANTFYVELSEPNGSFRNFQRIGSLQYNQSGTITCTLPADIIPGSNYRLRLASTNPPGYSRASAPLTIRTDCPTCHGRKIFTALRDTISDGSGEANYGNNSRCEFLIAIPGAASISLNFLELATERCCDLITIYEGGNRNRPMYAQVSGNDLPSTITIEHDSVLLIFTTNSLNTDAGWKLWYQAHFRTRIAFSPITKSRYCIGDTLKVNFGAIGFGLQNTFTLQISDAQGNFDNSTTLGAPSSRGPLQSIIPQTLEPGNRYRLRVISTIPPDTFVISSPMITIDPQPLPPNIQTNMPICVGDTLHLLASGEATTFVWKNPQGLIYRGNPWIIPNVSLNAAGEYNCQSVLGACSSEVTTVVVLIDTFNLPKPVIIAKQDTLMIANQYFYYQWWINGRPIAGANTYFIKASNSGNYAVTVQDSQGCVYTTPPFSYIPTWQYLFYNPQHSNEIWIYPNPTSGELRIRYLRDYSFLIVHVMLSTLEGKILKIWNNLKNREIEQVLLLPQEISSGIYLLEVVLEDNKKYHYKIQLQR
ncbi:MAG: CUB domain-containing protein [Bacteroidia bacterium]|nr:S8 family serine peptidase [Bacteroidia bacterium]MDW8158736.1 CUB domain-containing protein [Bacteroidia bacterium]